MHSFRNLKNSWAKQQVSAALKHFLTLRWNMISILISKSSKHCSKWASQRRFPGLFCPYTYSWLTGGSEISLFLLWDKVMSFHLISVGKDERSQERIHCDRTKDKENIAFWSFASNVIPLRLALQWGVKFCFRQPRLKLKCSLFLKLSTSHLICFEAAILTCLLTCWEGYFGNVIGLRLPVTLYKM